MLGSKWLYRLESTKKESGLWYNESGEFVLGISQVKGNTSQNIPMGYDERYKQDGKNWFSSCSKIEDLLSWYSLSDVKQLVDMGFRFYKYLAMDYHEYEKETVFLKETSLKKIEIDYKELFAEA